MVESQPSKLLVAGSSPVSRSIKFFTYVIKSQKVEKYYIGSTSDIENWSRGLYNKCNSEFISESKISFLVKK